MSTLDLDGIRTDIEGHAAELPQDVVCCVGCHIAVTDVPALLAEVERLRADLDSILRHDSAPAILAAHARLRSAVSTPDGTPTDG